jgi:alkaline phosphatase
MSRMRALVLCTLCLSGCVTPAAPLAPAERAKNVILFVGDGMGISTVTAARIFDGQARGESGEDNVLSFERFPNIALSKTYSTDAQVADSAATMTAMMSGVKTHSYALGVNASVTPGDCGSVARASVPTLLEQAEDRGLATGVVTTTRITHATPAATYAHSPHRNWEFDGMVPAAEQACADLARQLVEFDHGDGIDVVMGGGRALFLPAAAGGVRRDGRDLIAAWHARYPAGAYVGTASELVQTPATSTPLLGLFAADHLQFEHDRLATAADEPSLATMTARAIEQLARNPNGYFLMVEGGRIDHAHHLGNAYRALSETVAMAQAVATAVSLTDAKDTLIIVTADHSHTLVIGGYPARGNPILGLAGDLDGAGRPFTTLSYANGPGATAASDAQPAGPKRFPHEPKSFADAAVARPDLSAVDTTAPNYLQEALVPAPMESHAGEDVPVYARGPGAAAVHGVMEQNEIYRIMRQAFGW